MRFIHTDCEVRYSGRGDTILSRHERVLCFKDDGAFLVMGNKGIKPLNYMGISGTKPKYSETEENGIITIRIETSKEYIVVTCYRIFSEWEITLPGTDPGLVYDGTEDQLQEWLYNNLHNITNISAIEREFPTENGPVDLLGQYNNDKVLIEVKRTAMSSAVHQLRRYIEGSIYDDSLLIALDVRPAARDRAMKYGIPWIQLQKQGDTYIISETSDSFTYNI